MALYLSFKELWRNRGRFLLFSLVIALITALVLFVAAIGEGLGAGNREFIQKLTSDLLVYTGKSDLFIGASQIGWSQLPAIRRVEGVGEVGPLGFSNVTMRYGPEGKDLKVALIGVEPGAPGEPEVTAGQPLGGRRSKEVLLDRNVVARTGLKVGDTITVRSTQGTDDNLYTLQVVGLTDGQQYSLQPSILVPFRTWDRIRPQATPPGTAGDDNSRELIANVVAVRVEPGADPAAVQSRIQNEVHDVKVVDLKTAYVNTPGYQAQQSTLNTQRYFALLIGVLVIGGFFQIQTLQKVPQIGMLKAIGTANGTIAVISIIQITAITMLGVGIGATVTLLLSLGLPKTVPIIFNPQVVGATVLSLLLIGPIGGLVSVRYSTRIEPLTALGLSG